MSARKPLVGKPIVDLNDDNATLEDVVREAQGRSLRIELETGMRLVREGKNNRLATTCQARIYTKRANRSGAQTFVPLCMPIVGETWAECLEPLATLLDQYEWSDLATVT